MKKSYPRHNHFNIRLFSFFLQIKALIIHSLLEVWRAYEACFSQWHPSTIFPVCVLAQPQQPATLHSQIWRGSLRNPSARFGQLASGCESPLPQPRFSQDHPLNQRQLCQSYAGWREQTPSVALHWSSLCHDTFAPLPEASSCGSPKLPDDHPHLPSPSALR